MNESHGSPYDRGGADSYYRRSRLPHKIVDKTIIWLLPDTQEWDEYQAGYTENERMANFKDWGDETGQ